MGDNNDWLGAVRLLDSLYEKGELNMWGEWKNVKRDAEDAADYSNKLLNTLYDAYRAGIDLDALIKSNKEVREFSKRRVRELVDEEKELAKAQERQAKLEEKKRIEQEARRKVADKLTAEELAAYGLTAKGFKKAR